MKYGILFLVIAALGTATGLFVDYLYNLHGDGAMVGAIGGGVIGFVATLIASGTDGKLN